MLLVISLTHLEGYPVSMRPHPVQQGAEHLMRFVLIIVVGNIKSTILTVGQEGSVETQASLCGYAGTSMVTSSQKID
jgi:hypothetical protein